LRDQDAEVTNPKPLLLQRQVHVVLKPFQADLINLPLNLAPEALVDGPHHDAEPGTYVKLAKSHKLFNCINRGLMCVR
jgi:hypothetical protein